VRVFFSYIFERTIAAVRISNNVMFIVRQRGSDRAFRPRLRPTYKLIFYFIIIVIRCYCYIKFATRIGAYLRYELLLLQ